MKKGGGFPYKTASGKLSGMPPAVTAPRKNTVFSAGGAKNGKGGK